jgi:hypothetical protein
VGQRRGVTANPIREPPPVVSACPAILRTLLEAERDENTCREDMKPSEKVALGLALERQWDEMEKKREAPALMG